MVSIQLLGGVRLLSGDTVLGGPPAQRHRVALLTLIVDAWPQPLPRDRALALLWPERDEAGARRLLNLAVHVLRMALGEATIVSVADGLLWDPDAARCDLHDLRVCVAADNYAGIVQATTGPLLASFHLPDSVDFDQWLSQRRVDLGLVHVRALLAVADECETSGAAHELVSVYRRLVTADPYSGPHVLRLMRALDSVGERPAALECAREYARRLKLDLEMDPDPDVVALGASMRSTPRRDVALPSVAVLPFLSIGAGTGQVDFADGMTEDVIAHLAKVRALKVISRASVAPFRDRRQPLREVGHRLGVNTILDGSVRHDGDRVRIVATLVDASTEAQLWSETYDRQLADIFAIQSEVALNIAAALRAELTSQEQGRVRTEPTSDITAYRLFLQGRRHLLQYTLEGFRRSAEYFVDATTRDPLFAQAWTLQAMTAIHLAEHAVIPAVGLYERAEIAIRTALRLDPDSGDAHATAAYLRMAGWFDWTGARSALGRAVALSPGSAYVHDIAARIFLALEEYPEAIEHARRAQELDPLAHRNDLATTLLRAGQLERGLGHALDTIEVESDDSRSHATLGWAYLLNGRTVEGLAELERAVEREPDNAMWLGQLGSACGRYGDPARARAVLEQMEARARSTFVSPYHMAYVLTGLGDADGALDLLERAVAERSGTPSGIMGSILFAPIRDHPRFEALLRSMNLPA